VTIPQIPTESDGLKSSKYHRVRMTVVVTNLALVFSNRPVVLDNDVMEVEVQNGKVILSAQL
jgi:hypothetical protein